MIRTTSFATVEPLESRTLMSVAPTVAEVSHEGSEHSGSEDHPARGAVPARPSGLTAAVSGNKVTLAWVDHSADEGGFAVFRLSKGGWSLVGTVGANVTTFTDAAAPVGSDVYVVRAFNDAGPSEGSNAVTVKVNGEALATVFAPRKLRSQAVSTTSIRLSWEGDRGATGGFRVERSSDGQTGWASIGTTGRNERTFTDTGLTAGTKYYYRVVALGADNHAATSATLIGMTKLTDKGEAGKGAKPEKHQDAKPEKAEKAEKTEAKTKRK